MSTQTAATSTIEITSTTPVLMLSMELGETGWLLGFASAYGQKPLRRRPAVWPVPPSKPVQQHLQHG